MKFVSNVREYWAENWLLVLAYAIYTVGTLFALLTNDILLCFITLIFCLVLRSIWRKLNVVVRNGYDDYETWY